MLLHRVKVQLSTSSTRPALYVWYSRFFYVDHIPTIYARHLQTTSLLSSADIEFEKSPSHCGVLYCLFVQTFRGGNHVIFYRHFSSKLFEDSDKKWAVLKINDRTLLLLCRSLTTYSQSLLLIYMYSTDLCMNSYQPITPH